MSIEPINNVL